MNYKEAVDWIHSIGRFGSRPGLERVTELLNRIGNPERELRFIHVAGTNGKGSTSALLASMLRSNGYRVGLYTSPYLENFTNRVAMNGEDISHEAVAEWVNRIRPICEAIAKEDSLGHPTQFEIITAFALGYFAEQQVDIVVLEVGLGGRLDATNVVVPLVSVITTIGFDHQAILGDTLAKIAAEKAGIIKRGVPVVTGVRDTEPLDEIRRIVAENGSQFFALGEDFGYEAAESNLGGQEFAYRGIYQSWDNCRISLLGPHQIENASVALAVMECLERQGYSIDALSMKQGLEDAKWPGRLEIVDCDPLVVLDGAHNTHGTAALQRAVKQLFPGKRIILVLGILGDKDYERMMADLVPLASNVVITAPEYYRAANTDALAEVAQRFASDVTVVTPVSKAVDSAKEQAEPNDVVLVAGSLYTIGEARSHILRDV